MIRIRPSCYLFEVRPEGASLYLGETSTEQCLQILPPSQELSISEFGATIRGRGWFGVDDLPPLKDVAALLSFLQSRPDIELIDLTATIGESTLSTHDDGEANLTFRTEAECLAFLRVAVDSRMVENVIEQILANHGRYIAERGGIFQVYDSFDAYLAGA